MLVRMAIFAIGFILSHSAFAQTIDFSISKDSAQFQLIETVKSDALKRTQYGVGLLYAERGPEETLMGNLGMQVSGLAGIEAPGLTFGAGVEAFLIDIEQYAVSSITLHGLVRYAAPAFDRFAFTGEVYFGPSPVTFMDGKDFLMSVFRLSYEILPGTEVYAGFRKARTTIDGGPELTVEEGGNIGLRLSF